MNKLWYIHTVDFFPTVIIRNELLTDSMTWRILKNIVVSEKNRYERLHIHNFEIKTF